MLHEMEDGWLTDEPELFVLITNNNPPHTYSYLRHMKDDLASFEIYLVLVRVYFVVILGWYVFATGGLEIQWLALLHLPLLFHATLTPRTVIMVRNGELVRGAIVDETGKRPPCSDRLVCRNWRKCEALRMTDETVPMAFQAKITEKHP